MPGVRPKSSATHQNFEIGIAGRRTGVKPPTNVHRDSEGFEDISAYYSSPHSRAGNPSLSSTIRPGKHASQPLATSSPLRSLSVNSSAARRSGGRVQVLVPVLSSGGREKRARPDLHHEIGVLGRKTGVVPPRNVARDSAGFERFEEFLEAPTPDASRIVRARSVVAESEAQPRISKPVAWREIDDGDGGGILIDGDDMDLVGGGAALDHNEVDMDFIPDQHDDDYPTANFIDPHPDYSLDYSAGGEMAADDPDDTFAHTNGYSQGDVSGGGMGLEDIAEEDEDEMGAGMAQETRGRNKKPSREREPTPPGVRRSHRHRLPPLAYWRNERPLYRRRISTGSHGGPPGVAIVHIADVYRRPAEPSVPLSQKRRRGGRVGSVKREVSVVPPEEGMDAGTEPEGTVLNYDSQLETTRRVAFTSQMVDTQPPQGKEDEAPFVFQKVFSEGDFMAGGLLVVPKGKEKPLKPSRDNSYMFYVLEGAVKVTVHRTSFVVAPNGMFLVPRGNLYSIANTAERDAKLFFVQARRTPVEPAEPLAVSQAGPSRPTTTRAEEAEEEEEEEEEEDNYVPKKRRTSGGGKVKGKGVGGTKGIVKRRRKS